MVAVLALLEDLSRKGIKLSVEGDQLNCFAPNGVITDDVRTAIARHKPTIVEALRSSDRRLDAPSSAGSGLPMEFPLSVGQNMQYMLQTLNPERSYAVPICLRMARPVEIDALQTAWSLVQTRYPILTARVVSREGALHQYFDAGCRTTIQQRPFDGCDSQSLLSCLQRRAAEPFDLSRGPLARFDLFSLQGGESVLLIVVHHLIFDGFSVGVLLNALFTFYKAQLAGVASTAAPSSSGYQDFVAWEKAMLESEEGRAHAEFWRRQVGGELPALSLLPDSVRHDSDCKGRVLSRLLPAALTDWIAAYCQERSLTPAAMFLGVLQMLLHKYTGEEDIAVLMLAMVRPTRKFTADVGHFFNVLPMRARFDADLTVERFLGDSQKALLEALYHAAYPYSLISGTQDPERQPKVLYAYQGIWNMSDPASRAIATEFGLAPMSGFHERPEGDFELALEVYEDGSSFRLQVQTDPARHSSEWLERLLDCYVTLLQSISAAPAAAVSRLSMIDEATRRRILIENNSTDAPYPKESCIHHLFAERVRLEPRATAVAYGDQSLSYQELYDRSETLAHFLQAKGVGPDSVVALCADRCIEMVVGILGIVRAGAAYLPLNVKHPRGRLRQLLENSQARVVVTQERFRDNIDAAACGGAGTLVISVDSDWQAIQEAADGRRSSGEPLADRVNSRNMCYVIYTSGSTGNPKGVMVEHQALVNRINWMQKAYALRPEDVVLQKTPYDFDVSVWEFFWPLTTGARLQIAEPEGHLDVAYLQRLIRDSGVTTLHFTPSVLRTFVDQGTVQCASVSRVFCSGEALDRQSVDRYRERFPNAGLYNLYGPTEAAIDVTAFDCARAPASFVPIGKPIDNIQIHILDSCGNPQPTDVPGELHIAGDGLARGYLNMPEMTREKFVENPFRPGERMYKTGDLARWLPDGNIQYLGRIDSQVKIAGARLEVAEIEAHLQAHPGVREAAVALVGEDDSRRLVAFYLARGTIDGKLAKLPNRELRGWLADKLPDYMIPATFISLPEIPLTSSGKIDRRALGAEDVALEAGSEFVAPRTETERRVAEVWSKVLKGQGILSAESRIGVTDNFFEIGGNSLLAGRLCYVIRAELGVEIPVRTVLQRGTVAALAEIIDDALEYQAAAAGASAEEAGEAQSFWPV